MGGGRQKRLWVSYWLNCSYTDLMTDMLMVCKFRFVHYGHMKKKSLALYVLRLNSDCHEVSDFQKEKF